MVRPYPFSFDWSTYLDACVIKAVWPAFWTVGNNWPNVRVQTLESCIFIQPLSQQGEIDILEGVHDNEHNQIAWHTAAGKLISLSFHSVFHWMGRLQLRPRCGHVGNC